MKVLLHICCAVCATFCLEKLRREDYEVFGYFYNPNIQPPEEYQKRLQDAKKLSQRENLPLIVGDYELDEWFTRIKGLEGQPEGGARCASCFSLRLERAAKLAKENSFDFFTTTLTVSPHKNAQTINKIGQAIGDNLFLERDFKKQDGFKKTQELAKRYNFYHQDYCGCSYSLNQRQKK